MTNFAGIEDDASIPDDLRLLRRVHPQWICDFRPDSSNFKNKKDGEGLSVTAWLSDEDLQATIAEEPTFGVVRTTAGELRAIGLKIVRAPLDDNPNHCECFGKPSKNAPRLVAKAAKWVRPPASHDPDPYGQLETL